MRVANVDLISPLTLCRVTTEKSVGMPEVRQDSLLGYRVLFAPERALRPFEQGPVATSFLREHCPFCRGNEAETTAAVLELPAVDAREPQDWGVRVISNRYPAVAGVGPEDAWRVTHASATAALGVHDVIVEAPQHVTSMTSLSAAQFRLIVQAYRQRLRDIRDAGQAVHASLFKNNGVGAGASLEHVHSQLIATSFVTAAVAQESALAARHFAGTSSCYFCDVMQHELRSRQRLVFETADFICWCPFASRYASEMCLMPRRHRAGFEQLDDAELAAFADALRDCLLRLDRALPGVAFNFVIHSAEFAAASSPHFHWHLEVLPRVMGLAGFELGAGCHINVTLPEVAAAALRAAT